MKEISIDNIIYAMGEKHNAPAEHVQQDELFRVHTKDASDGQYKPGTTWNDCLTWNHKRTNPATGPVYIHGAKQGDILAVSIEAIDVADSGYARCGKNKGVLGDTLHGGQLTTIPIENGHAIYPGVKPIPLNKMVGVIGTAPAESREILCVEPGPHGGNLDCKEIKEGATVFLPVNVPGAMLSMGDLHAVMADGESGVSGLEVVGTVTVKANAIEGRDWPLPMVRTNTHVITLSSHEDLDVAVKAAVANMVHYLTKFEGFAQYDAVMLVSLVADVKICQLVNPKKTARVEFPREYLRNQDIYAEPS
ncbi:MAG: acetamidase/formamidase family protein [Defluviitaleaceae bacterium]|nr:acetamidase/formamidase family protein [Defluviitaleaceae bacterium]